MKKQAVVLLVLISLVAVLALPAAAAEKITLRWSGYYSLQDRAKGWPIVVEMYKKQNPNVEIELWTGAQNYNEALRTQFAAGDPPDIVGIQHTRFLDYAARGLLVDITDFFEENGYRESLYGLSQGWSAYNGRIYGMSDNPAPIEWFYNVGLFEDLGLTEPETLDDLIAAGKKLQAAGVFPIVWGSLDYWTNVAVLGMITAQTMGLDPVFDAFETKNWQIPGLLQALEIMVLLRDEGLVDPLITGIDYNASEAMFVNGQVGIFPMGSWAVSSIEASQPDDFRYSVFKKPVMFVDNPFALWSASGGQIHAVTTASKNQEQALDFLKFVFSEECQEIISREGNMVSSMMVTNKMFEDHPVVALNLEHLTQTNEHSGMLIDYLPIAVMDSLGVSIQAMLNGTMAPAQVLEEIQKADK